MFLVLPTSRLREIFSYQTVADPEDIPGCFMSAQPFTNPRLHFVVCEIGTLFAELQETADDFSISLIVDSNNTGLGDGRMDCKSVLNLSGVDIFSSCTIKLVTGVIV